MKPIFIEHSYNTEEPSKASQYIMGGLGGLFFVACFIVIYYAGGLS